MKENARPNTDARKPGLSHALLEALQGRRVYFERLGGNHGLEIVAND